MPMSTSPGLPQRALCIDNPHDTIYLPADRILRRLHGQNMGKWGYYADDFRSEFDTNPALVPPNVSSLYEIALHGRLHSRNNPNVKQIWHSTLTGDTGLAGFVIYSIPSCIYAVLECTGIWNLIIVNLLDLHWQAHGIHVYKVLPSV